MDFPAISIEEKKRIRQLFERETGGKWTYSEIRQAGRTGYTEVYLQHKFNVETLTTTAKPEFVHALVKLDLAEKTKPEVLVFVCCKWFPIVQLIEEVIRLTGTEPEKILSYKHTDGNTCFMIMFHVLTESFVKQNKDTVKTKMAENVEKSVDYFIELGDKLNLDMNKILERTNRTGQTLFALATIYSEKLVRALLQREINAKSIDHYFQTPFFKNRSLHEVMVSAGIDPYAFSYLNKTQFEYFKISVPIPPELTSNLFFSTTRLPCDKLICPQPCHQDLQKAWYYNNGRIYDFKQSDRIGIGGEGAVFAGIFHGRPASFKLVEIKSFETVDYNEDAVIDLRERLNEMRKLSVTNGPNIVRFFGHVRQQLDPRIVYDLGLGSGVKRFEVYITKKCDSNLAEYKKTDNPKIEITKSIIDQLIDSQEQLQAAGVSHNDIKPGNILINIKKESEVQVFIGDFGQADKKGGTPGWTSPEFIEKRLPGVTDMYSFGLVFLYLLCEDIELFYALRDNIMFEKHVTEPWYQKFLKLTEIKLVLQMVKPEPVDRISIVNLKEQWYLIRESVQMITKDRLNFPEMYEKCQGNPSINELENLIGGSLQPTETMTTFTRTHLQGDTEFCWLYSITSSIRKSLKIKAGTKF